MPFNRFCSLAVAALAVGLFAFAPVADAASKTSKHGVRVHRLMDPVEPVPEPEEAPTVVAHSHKSLKVERVVKIVRWRFGPSRYRVRHPGILRPWRARRHRVRRTYANPRYLYSSKIYRNRW